MRSPLLLLAWASLGLAAPPVFRVSEDGGTHSTLQSAVDACPASGCRIELPDAIYEFAEPVSIRGRSDISIVGARPDGSRPVLRIAPAALVEQTISDIGGHSTAALHPVRFGPATPPDTLFDLDGSASIRQFATDTGDASAAAGFLIAAGRNPDGSPDPLRPQGWMLSPTTSAAARESDAASSGHTHAALVLVDHSHRILLSGLEFASNAPIETNTKAVWDGTTDNPSGIAAIALVGSLEARVENNLFHGWSVAIRVHDGNRGGLLTDILKRQGHLPESTPSLITAGTTGGHRIEGNLAHGNHFAVVVSTSMDLASRIRFNRFWENGLTRMIPRLPRGFSAGSQGWRAGGAICLAAETWAPHVIQGNTLVRNTYGLFWKGDRSLGAYYLDNVEVRRDEWNAWIEPAEAVGWDTTDPMLRSNWFASNSIARYDNIRWRPAVDSIVPFCGSARCEAFTPTWGSPAIDAFLVGKGWLGDDLGAVWHDGIPATPIAIHDQGLAFVRRDDSGWSVTLPLPVEAPPRIRDLRIAQASARFLESRDGGASGQNSSTFRLAAIEGRSIPTGVSVLRFHLPATAQDLLWRLEMVASGTDANTGRRIHSNLGTWLLRPLGRQLLVETTDSSVQPGETIDFAISARDSAGNAMALESAPVLQGEGWTLVDTIPSIVSARSTGTIGTGYIVRARAPEREGISRVAFRSLEDSSTAPAPALSYVRIAGPVFDTTSLAPVAAARTLRIRRVESGWSIESTDPDPHALEGATIVDARGRTIATSRATTGRNPSIIIARPALGTCFLRSGGTTTPFVLVP